MLALPLVIIRAKGRQGKIYRQFCKKGDAGKKNVRMVCHSDIEKKP